MLWLVVHYFSRDTQCIHALYSIIWSKTETSVLRCIQESLLTYLLGECQELRLWRLVDGEWERDLESGEFVKLNLAEIAFDFHKQKTVYQN